MPFFKESKFSQVLKHCVNEESKEDKNYHPINDPLKKNSRMYFMYVGRNHFLACMSISLFRRQDGYRLT